MYTCQKKKIVHPESFKYPLSTIEVPTNFIWILIFVRKILHQNDFVKIRPLRMFQFYFDVVVFRCSIYCRWKVKIGSEKSLKVVFER